MGVFDDNFDERIVRHAELCRLIDEFVQIFNQGVCSALLIDSDDEIPLGGDEAIIQTRSKEPLCYFDLSACKDGDYRLILRELTAPQVNLYGGVLFDNIDRIPDIPERESLEQLVLYAMKRDTFPAGSDKIISFDRLNIGARSHIYPIYLEGCDLQMVVISTQK